MLRSHHASKEHRVFAFTGFGGNTGQGIQHVKAEGAFCRATACIKPQKMPCIDWNTVNMFHLALISLQKWMGVAGRQILGRANIWAGILLAGSNNHYVFQWRQKTYHRVQHPAAHRISSHSCSLKNLKCNIKESIRSHMQILNPNICINVHSSGKLRIWCIHNSKEKENFGLGTRKRDGPKTVITDFLSHLSTICAPDRYSLQFITLHSKPLTSDILLWIVEHDLLLTDWKSSFQKGPLRDNPRQPNSLFLQAWPERWLSIMLPPRPPPTCEILGDSAS